MGKVNIGEMGKIEYNNIGLLTVKYPFYLSSDRIVTAFVYDLIEKKFIDSKLRDYLEFEIEPNKHVFFELVCDINNCKLKIYSINVATDIKCYGDYEQEEISSVTVNNVYSVEFDRNRFRSFSVDDTAPDILRFILGYLIPIDLPYNQFYYSDVNEIVDKIKQFF